MTARTLRGFRSSAGRTLAALSLTVGVATAAQAERSALAGRWATQGIGSIVEFRPCAGAPETMCGRIVWLWQERDADGRPRVDGQRPDPAARNTPLLGIEIVRGLRELAPGAWGGGELYNPDDGRTYTGDLRVRGDQLELRGCALRIFCQTQTWRRPEAVIAAVQGLAP